MKREKTYKQIEESRNRRLWITEVMLPVATMATTLYAIPEARTKINKTVNNVKRFVNAKINELKLKIRIKRGERKLKKLEGE